MGDLSRYTALPWVQWNPHLWSTTPLVEVSILLAQLEGSSYVTLISMNQCKGQFLFLASIENPWGPEDSACPPTCPPSIPCKEVFCTSYVAVQCGAEHDDRVCSHKMVSSPWAVALMWSLLGCHWCLVCGLHTGRASQEEALLSWQRLHGSVDHHHHATGHAFFQRAQLHHQS